jgi:plasmid stability protein
LDLPPALTEDWEETLRDLGLGQSKTIEVWPAGLSAIVWDGEGHGEWLASERPCLGIQTDHPLANLLISMGPNDNLALELTSVEPGKPIFVELPNLPVGLHKVHVSTQSSQTGQEEFLGDLDIVMRIRDARPWSPGVSPHGPLIVQMEPSAPTLEQLWEGRIAITFRGPANRNIKCRVSLSEKSDSVLFFKQLPPMRLPVTSDGWRVHFEKHFRTTKEAEKFYDNARICELEFVADELGALKIRCEREFTPLRWSLRRRGQDYFIRLLDDSGSDVQPEVKHLPFETPCIEKMLEYAPELAVPESGGLYFACIPAFSTAIIVPPQIRELADLGCFPRIDRGTHSTESISHALEVSRIWGQARLPGDLISATRQRDVLRALARHIAQLLGGDTWGRAETAAYKRGEDLAILKSAISKRREEIAIGIVLMRDCGNLADETCDKKVKRIASLAMNFHILRPSMHLREYDEEWISELALRLASDPAGVEAWARDILVVGLVRLMEVPTLARAARFLVLATDHHLNSKVAPGELYAGWRWT